MSMELISREEAIKCLECDFDITGRANMEVVVNYINSAHDKIMNLPSVKQEPILDFIKDCKNKIENYGKDYMFTQEEVLNIIERYAIKYTKSFKRQESEG